MTDKENHSIELDEDIDSFDNAEVIVPHIEKDIPIPKSQKEAMPEMSSEEEVTVRANTINAINDINNKEIKPDEGHKVQAERLANEMINNPDKKPEFENYANETLAYLAGIVAQSSSKIVKEYTEFKHYIVNRAVQEAEMAKSARDRLSALRMLGEVDGVDAFKKKTEITHISKTGKELEEELLKTIEDLKGKVIEGEILGEESEDDQP